MVCRILREKNECVFSGLLIIKTVGCFETLLNNRLVLEFLQGVNWNSEHDKK